MKRNAAHGAILASMLHWNRPVKVEWLVASTSCSTRTVISCLQKFKAAGIIQGGSEMPTLGTWSLTPWGKVMVRCIMAYRDELGR